MQSDTDIVLPSWYVIHRYAEITLIVENNFEDVLS